MIDQYKNSQNLDKLCLEHKQKTKWLIRSLGVEITLWIELECKFLTYIHIGKFERFSKIYNT